MLASVLSANKNNDDSPRSASDMKPVVAAQNEEEEAAKFVMKNGCCRECMRAFSKSGKVSLSLP